MFKHGNSGRKPARRTSHRMRVLWLLLLTVGILSAAGWMFQQPEAATSGISAEKTDGSSIKLWEPLVSPRYMTYEKIALVANVFVALAGLIYAGLLVKEVYGAPKGTRACKRSHRPCARAQTPICIDNFA